MKGLRFIFIMIAMLVLHITKNLQAQEHDHHGHHGHHGHETSDELPAGHVKVSDRAMKAAEIVIEGAGQVTLNVSLKLNGKLVPNEDRVAHLHPRYSGIIREVRKKLGDQVEVADELATIESNQSLQPYQIRSLTKGVLTRRHASVGEFVNDETELFEVSDYSELWADFFVFSQELSKAKVGTAVIIRFNDQHPAVEAKVSFISPATDESTQARIVRAFLPNTDLTASPGAFVTGDLILEKVSVPVAVNRSALQSIGGETVVFVQEGEMFVARTVATGRSDDRYVEILAGVNEGEKYAAGNTFVLKAELGKSEAHHEH